MFLGRFNSDALYDIDSLVLQVYTLLKSQKYFSSNTTKMLKLSSSFLLIAAVSTLSSAISNQTRYFLSVSVL